MVTNNNNMNININNDELNNINNNKKHINNVNNYNRLNIPKKLKEYEEKLKLIKEENIKKISEIQNLKKRINNLEKGNNKNINTNNINVPLFKSIKNSFNSSIEKATLLIFKYSSSDKRHNSDTI